MILSLGVCEPFRNKPPRGAKTGTDKVLCELVMAGIPPRDQIAINKADATRLGGGAVTIITFFEYMFASDLFAELTAHPIRRKVLP